MTKLKTISVRRHAGSIFILAIVLSSAIYLIMVNTVFSKAELNYGKLVLLNTRANFQDTNEFHKRDLDHPILTSHSLKNAIQGKSVKLILLWSPLFEGWDFLQEGKHSFEQSSCLETRCEITSDRKRILESDAVLFHMRTLSMFDVPQNRLRSQKWIFFSLEAPPYSRFQGFEFMSGMFNWTMTYRKDSDVYIPYGRIVPQTISNFSESDLHAKWKMKSKLAVWMVSHCSTSGNRESYIDRLREYMDVDIYGSCGHLGSCPYNKTNLCIENFSEKYYFFLAFENAICVDYVTEKLFRTLQYDMIPVVFGGGNYSATAPPHSFIDALQYPSPKQLASHLLKVASDFTLFFSYFQWRVNYSSSDIPNHCDLCQKLHSESFQKESVYPDINEWWLQKSHCKKWIKGSQIE